MKKQLWGFFILVGIVFFTSSVVFATSDIESVLIAVKSKIEIPDEYTTFESSSQVTDGKNEWRFWWRTSGDNPEKSADEISVIADAAGNIKRYYHYKNEYVNNDSRTHFTKYDKSDARIYALRFVTKVCPDLINKIEFNQQAVTTNISKDLKTANVSFYRNENKIPYYSNYMNFVVNMNTAEVIQFDCVWDYDLVFPEAEKIITPQAARRSYEAKAGIELRYRLHYEGTNKQAYLVYVPINENKMVDATSGDVFDGSIYYSDNPLIARGAASNTSNKQDGLDVKFTEQEILELNSVEKVMTISQAEEYIRSISELSINEEYMLKSSSFTKKDSRYLIYLEFVKQPNINAAISDKERAVQAAGDNSYVRVIVDAANMDVVTLYRYNKEAQKQVENVSLESARQQVDEFLLKYLKNKYVNCSFKNAQKLDAGNTYRFTYICMLSGVPFEGNGITVQYDAKTGEITSIICDWQFNVSVEGASGIIPLDQGKGIIFNKAPLQLTYVNRVSFNDKSRMPQIVLAYILNPFTPKNVLAKTGEIIKDDKKPYKFSKYEKFSDIEGHYAQVQIQRLSNNLIIDESGQFRPFENITQSAFLNMIYAGIAGNRYDNDEDLYSAAIQNKIISTEERNPSAEVTRQMAVVYFIRLMGYDEVARLQNIYTLNYSDLDSINSEFKGYIALAKGFGIIGNNSTFNPQEPLIRADAAVMVYNYLNR